jgi:hypothetical protein
MKMPKFEVCFRDEIEVENEEEAVDALIQYLSDCVRFQDVSVFNIYKLKEEHKDNDFKNGGFVNAEEERIYNLNMEGK